MLKPISFSRTLKGISMKLCWLSIGKLVKMHHGATLHGVVDSSIEYMRRLAFGVLSMFKPVLSNK